MAELAVELGGGLVGVPPQRVEWRLPMASWGLVVAVVLALAFTFRDGLAYLLEMWNAREEYGYGYLIPPIALFLIWQRQDQLRRLPFEGSWTGFLLVAAGLLLFVAGELSTLYIVVHYAFVLVLAGLGLALLGRRAFRVVAMAFLLPVFMIPLPDFLYKDLSAQLQLISSQLGVAVIRLFGISVHLEGNVIDLGSLQLQVVEACNGLRYLFPLMTLAFVAAYFYQGARWQRLLLFLSSIPISILLNSLRIGAVGVTVEHWGRGMAQGLLHDFEGWSVFMASVVVLMGEMWLFARLGRERRPLGAVFGLAPPVREAGDARVRWRTLPGSFLGAILLLAGVSLLALMLPARSERVPPRASFSAFPMAIGPWQGRAQQLEPIYLKVLHPDDYLLADFRRGGGETGDAGGAAVNLYSTYYTSQRKGASVHSPRSCIPGGGWEIADLAPRRLALPGGGALAVNRALIQQGEARQVVYYWFAQRGRNLTSEYLVKWYVLWDALTRSRSDGAMVRLTTSLAPGESPAAADRRLAEFAGAIAPRLGAYVPD